MHTAVADSINEPDVASCQPIKATHPLIDLAISHRSIYLSPAACGETAPEVESPGGT